VPKVSDKPVNLRPYLFHGLDLEWEGRDQAVGECPFCGKEGKFYVALETGKWDCKVCAAMQLHSSDIYTTVARIKHRNTRSWQRLVIYCTQLRSPSGE
jgi:ribosomal protein L37AE/L43A